MKRIAVLNNYSFENVWDEVLQGHKPDHHLYGINHFHQRGYEVEIVPFQSAKLLLQLSRQLKQWFPIPLGNLDQQWSTLQRLSQADLIYAPCQTESHLLSYLRAMGLIETPIVCIAHHPLNRGRLSPLRQPFIKLWVQGTDAFPALSVKLSDSINQLVEDPLKSIPLSWGPDPRYYPSMSSVGHGVVAAGRTGRDFVTFGLAASQSTSSAHIICLESAVTSVFQSFSSRVQITVRPDRSPMAYPELIEAYTQARVIAIPMYAGSSLCGLTSLMDALALGKPVIMTRNQLIDIEIEAEGIGLWVEPNDIEGWKRAIQFFEDHETEALVMGQRARRLMETKFNSDIFANQVMDIFDAVLMPAQKKEPIKIST
jgi:hypothetical protein